MLASLTTLMKVLKDLSLENFWPEWKPRGGKVGILRALVMKTLKLETQNKIDDTFKNFRRQNLA